MDSLTESEALNEMECVSEIESLKESESEEDSDRDAVPDTVTSAVTECVKVRVNDTDSEGVSDVVVESSGVIESV
jgi:hypothetical protein